jgi:carbon-monoxide dehydrogenase small subunit
MTEVALVTMTVNGKPVAGHCEPRKLLVDFLREDLGLTGTHIGCEHGVCGACTITLDGQAARSCTLLAVQGEGAEIETIEGLARGVELTPLQQAFHEKHGLQCGFCTPGMIMQAAWLLADNPDPSEEEIRIGISGNLCRCTGYVNIVKAIQQAAGEMAAAAATQTAGAAPVAAG